MANNGDTAATAGMDVVASTAQRSLGYDEINKTRDYIVTKGMPTVVPITKGGTNGTTAAAARTNLGVQATVDAVNGARSAAAGNALVKWDAAGRIQAVSPSNSSDVAIKSYVDGKVSKSGDTMSGDLKIPNASAASSSYVVAYINGDGRISKGASSRRFKRNIRRPKALPDVFSVALSEFEMRGGDGSRILGYIAEDLVGTPMERFVVYDSDGQPEAIDWIQLLLVQVVALQARVVELEQRNS